MKPTTKDWLLAAEDDLLAAKTLASNQRLTNLAAFHCQQCTEKCIKAIIEEKEITTIKSHDLSRLLDTSGLKLSAGEIRLLEIINEVYIDSRYPGELGLLPFGKPSPEEINSFIAFCERLHAMVVKEMFC